MTKKTFSLFILLSVLIYAKAQLLVPKETFTKADTLRGSDNENRNWWDVLKYGIAVTPDFNTKTIDGMCFITFKVLKEGKIMQLDLQDSLVMDFASIDVGKSINRPNYSLDNVTYCDVLKTGSVYYVNVPYLKVNTIQTLKIKYHGKPREAVKPPWDGGWIWTKDSLGNPWMSVACQGLGASSWYPCKDIQSDEPDWGMNLSILAPDSLTVVSNGRQDLFYDKIDIRLRKWVVRNPINNYNIIPYIGKYANFTDTLMGEGGKLDLSYWVLRYNLERAKKQFTQVKPMLHCFEYWFGKYPFYEDSYKLVEAPHLGMEHQSAIAYGNGFHNGYRGSDLSGSGWGKKWDFIIIHESGHEWFGNSITSKDLADQWIHESFTMYSEVLYTQWMFGKEAGNDYCVGLRGRIQNDKPIVGPYGVNKEGSGDMYYKGANMIHSIRHIINNDSLFRQILRGLNREFYHQTVTAKQIEDYMITNSGIDLQAVFNQYLTTTQIPTLVYKSDKKTFSITLRWTNCISSFNMPITIPSTNKRINITMENSTVSLTKEEFNWFTKTNLVRDYLIEVESE